MSSRPMLPAQLAKLISKDPNYGVAYTLQMGDAPKKQSTKQCPKCGSTRLIPFRSMNEKQCGDCWHIFPWYLDPGQKPLL